MNRIKNIAYPIIKHPKGYFRNADNDLESIKSSIATIVLTESGERIFEPHFGVNYSSVNLNAPREVVQDQFRVRIASSLKRWEKRVQVHDIATKLDVVKGDLILMIVVYFINPLDIKNMQELTIYRSLGGIDGRPVPF